MAAYDPEKITFFAKTDARGQQVPFGIKSKDRQRHMYVIGKTGMGKSTLLENMAAQDIQSGEGMAFIDPHGSAIETLLEYVPEDRLDDVVYFAPFDMENPIAFNIMEDVGIDKRHLVVSGLMSTFKKIWVDAWSARMEYILTNALLALIEYPDTTLLSVNRMLADKTYRDKVVENVKDPAVKAYWVDEFASYTERFAAEALPAIQNKIGQFTGNPLIRNIIGQPKSSFDVRKMMDERKILLINLSKGLVGETNADLIGSMLITKIYLAAMSRAELPPAQMKQMPNFYFFVDEFQSFANATFANILSEARKYHLNLIIAHQYVQQMEEEIRDAVFGNVGTTISFRVGPFDAEVLETVFAPQFEATDLVNLGFAQIYLSLMIDGVGSQPFSAVTLPPVATPEKSHKHMVIKRSQQNFCKPRAEVEQLVIDSHSPDKRIEAAAESGGGNKGGFAKPSAFHKVGSDKKPPPKKNGNANNNGQNNNQRPKQPSKTADDLKNILAGMTGQTRSQSDDPKKTTDTESEIKKPTSDESKIKQQTTGESEVKKPVTRDPDKTSNLQSQPADSPNSKSAVAPTASANSETKPKSENNPKPNLPEQSTIPRKTLGRSGSNNKPAKTETTPDDLRSILAQMAAKTNNSQSSAATNKSGNYRAQAAPKSNSGPVSNKSPNEPLPRKTLGRPNQSNNQDRLAGQTLEKGKQTQAKNTPATPDELRSVLKAMVDNKNNRTQPSGQPAVSEKRSTTPATQRHQTNRSTHKTEDLKTALAKVVEKTNNLKPDTAIIKTPVQLAETVVSSPVSVTDTTVYKQSAEPAVGGVRQPAFVPHENTVGPDLATVKKILRHSGKERPPGS